MGDVNSDGRLDLVVANNNSDNVTILLGDGRGNFTPATSGPARGGSGPGALAIGDFNHDGHPDLAVADNRGDKVMVALGNGVGGFLPAPGAPYPAGNGPAAVVVGDFNRDGTLDVAAANSLSSDLTVLLGSCVLPTSTPCPVPFTDVMPADYFYTPVQYLVCHGVISGYNDSTFRP